jgi:hypothetical protein
MFQLSGLLALTLGERGASGESDTGDESDRRASYDSFQHVFLEAGLMRCRAELWGNTKQLGKATTSETKIYRAFSLLA